MIPPPTFSPRSPLSAHVYIKHMKLLLSSSQLPVIQGEMPLLYHLDLQIHDEQSVIDTDAFRQLPRLRSAILNDISATCITLPWAQLTSLTLERVFLYKCVTVLKQTSNLVHCHLILATSFWDAEIPDITLPCLETFYLENWLEDDREISYLDHFIVPSLRTLELPEDFLGTDPIAALASLVSRSGCRLQEVCIYGPPSITEQQCRQAVPTVSKWSLSDRNGADSIRI
ncbi:hypothetical protein DFH06DRAFT_439329 [Mycena polygramma]|nr:hypothetical protein DFH06DRAFT_439329 [Mycena polygramma]